MTQFVVVVPARAGSAGLRNKNLLPLAGEPLALRSVRQGLQCGAETVVLSTDIESLLSSRTDGRVRLHRRRSELATDDADMSDVLADVVDAHAGLPDITVLLQPTSPLRELEDITNCIALFRQQRHELVLTACKEPNDVLKCGFTLDSTNLLPLGEPRYMFANRQSLPDVVRPNGAVYVFSAKWLREKRELSAASRIGFVEMPNERSIDVDSQADLDLCRQKLREGVRE